MEIMDMHEFVRGIVSGSLGLFVGFSAAFIFSPVPTGLLVTGMILTVVLTVVFYVGISKVTTSEPE